MHGPVEVREGADLATMICDQFVALGHRRPAVARVLFEQDVVLLVLAWREDAAEELLNEVAPTLAELVGIEAHRQIVDLRTAVTPDRCRAMVSFVLGLETDDSAERAAALRNWARQVRRNAVSQRLAYRSRREELRRFRTELARSRLEARTR